ncbi:ABC transporter substrate-binding protein [Rhodococcus antarcticus]|uniref:ABC transporter substrate-binding protein n=1 Tax=Rhodococcus antarcticus TaxID=2987751 RepID=A0ABY6P1Q3_9NOCA|nr:ABC transporter substrate-binding protein [Rhodococcus antarcticus]UZJ25582.1 ABC transporter substrate-binding protein [Rhodococcus antarcticus]
MALLATGAVVLTACGSSSDALGGGQATQDKVIVASANFPENELIAEMYAGALESAGITVEKKLNIGARELYVPAIQNGEISVVPDYTGNLLLLEDTKATAASSADVYTALKAALPADLKVLDYSPAEDKDALVVTPAIAAQYKLKSIEDLTPVCSQLVVGASASFPPRQAGLVGITEKYSCTFKEFRSLDTGGPLTLNALLNNDIQVADLYTTDSNIPDNNLVVLEDPKNVFPAQNVVPLYKDGSLSDAAKQKLNDVSKALDTATLTTLLRQVTTDKMPAQTVAMKWLKDKGLV